MDPPPPPPPPHGQNPKTSSGLPPGKFEIFIIPDHQAGGGFLYLPSMRPNVNSFVAGFASCMIIVVIFNALKPVIVAWWSQAKNSGGSTTVMLVCGIALGAWVLGRAQSGGPGLGPGNAGGAAGPGTGGQGGAYAGEQRGGQQGGYSHAHSNGYANGHAGSPPPPPPGSQPGGTQPGPQPNSRHMPNDQNHWEQPPTPEPKPEPQWQQSPPPPGSNPEPRPQPNTNASAKAAWEKAREETRKREEERKTKEAEQRRREELEKKIKAMREKEAREREAREKKKQEEEDKLKAQKKAEDRAKELAEARAKLAERRAAEAAKKAAAEKEAAAKRAAEELAAKKATEAAASRPPPSTYAYSSVGERMSPWPNGRPPSPKAVPKPQPTPPASPKKPPPPPTAKTYLDTEDDAYSYRPYDKPKRPTHVKSASSIYSESSYASQTTSRTTPPPSNRGPYSTKDPDKIQIKAVYAFTNAYVKTPTSQLISGMGSVTDGLILRITTEGLFVDDDVRGVPQREWDVKAWTLKLVETGENKNARLHVLRASIRDQEGKKYVFVITEEESWKVAVGLQRLRKGKQVRALGVSGMTANDARTTLECLGWT